MDEQDPLAATRSVDVRVGFVWHGAGSPAGEGDHELVGSQHVGHALSSLVRWAWLLPTEVPASTKKSGQGLP